MNALNQYDKEKSLKQSQVIATWMLYDEYGAYHNATSIQNTPSKIEV